MLLLLLLAVVSLAATPAERFFDAYVAAARDGRASALAALYSDDAEWVRWPGRAPFTDHATVAAELARVEGTGCRTEVELGLFGGHATVLALASMTCPADPQDANAARHFSIASLFHVNDAARVGTSQVWIAPLAMPPPPGTSAAAPVREEETRHGPGVALVRLALNLLPGTPVHPFQLAGDPWRTAHYHVLHGVFVGFDPSAPRREPGTWDLQVIALDDAGGILQRRLYFATDPLRWQPLSGRPRGQPR